MEEVVYSLNGIEFNTKNNPYKIFVSKSDGLMAKLKPKAKTTYEWPNQHGKQSNPLQKVRYESREISLECWVEGSGWKEMKDNYDALMSEFDKLGTQRLIISPFGTTTPLIYDVALVESSDPKQAFNKGEMVGVFTIKMTEERPVKKVLYTASTNLQLSFNSPSQVIINIDGKAQQAKGDVSINTNLPIRSVGKNLLNGRNLVFGTSQPRTLYTTSLNESYFEYDMVLLEPNSEYTISFYHAFDPTCKGMHVYVSFKNPDQIVLFKELPPTNSQWGQKQVFQFTTDGSSHALCKVFVYNMGSKDGASAGVAIKELKIEKGNNATDWTPAPEDQHYISIAGNIDEITNLNTNAQILWEKL
ncbi:TPA: hypothetical protein NEG48_001489 [Elizabethkingia anophelis]|nr:hypothetical protein [Elizabethkingia anophelis]